MTDMTRYVKDLKTIREIMISYEEQPIVKPWAFYSWGGVCILGTLIHFWLYGTIGLAGRAALLRVWLPVLVIGSLGETLAWLFYARDAGMALLTRRSKRMLAGYVGIIIALALLVIDGIPAGLHVGTALAIGSVPLLAYAQLTFSALYVEGFLLLAIALVFRAAGVNSPSLYLVGGILTGVTYIGAGIHSWRMAQLRARPDE